MLKFYHDNENNFIEMFNPENGYYIRSGVIEDSKDTGVDSFKRNMPALLDIGIMGHCEHSTTGVCAKAGVQCYQGGNTISKPNMRFNDYKSIIDQVKNCTFQVALGGRGDPNKHEHFSYILKYTRESGIVPNYTTSGFNLTEEEIKLTKEYCGAVAVSEYFTEYTNSAIDRFVKEGCITNIHFVLSNSSIDKAIQMLRFHEFPEGINAVIFLLHKPIGLGQQKNVLKVSDPKLNKFFEVVDNWKGDFKIGFDSCTIPGILNFTKNINRDSIDSCEGGRFSAYISSDMIMVPCSFDSSIRWGVNLDSYSIEEAWDSDAFKNFRKKMMFACPECADKNDCYGGCPIVENIVLCDRKERE